MENLRKRRGLIVGAIVLCIGYIVFVRLRAPMEAAGLLAETYSLMAEAQQKSAAQGAPAITLPSLPYALLGAKEAKDRDECVANSKKFGDLQNLNPEGDLIGMCTCLKIALNAEVAAIENSAAADHEAEVESMRILNAIQAACRKRHGV